MCTIKVFRLQSKTQTSSLIVLNIHTQLRSVFVYYVVFNIHPQLHITLHHITSHHITSHHITSHHITSHHITSHHITSHHITSHHITSHHMKLWKFLKGFVYENRLGAASQTTIETLRSTMRPLCQLGLNSYTLLNSTKTECGCCCTFNWK